MKIYRQYDQQQLNDQYNTRLQVPGFAAYFDQWEALSRSVDQEFNYVPDISYGEDPLECLDIFPSATPASKTMIFIHGGYWHLLDKSQFHFLARPFLQRNITTVIINYPLAPVATIDSIVASCRKALQWVHDHIAAYNGDPSEIYVTGHSAGGHLATMLLTAETGVNISGVISLSGLFRLQPIMHSYVNEVLGMDIQLAERNSPVLLLPQQHAPLLLIAGVDESNEFQTQSHELHNYWKTLYQPVNFLLIENRNHYSILDTLTDEGSLVQQKLFAMMQVETPSA